MDSRSLGVSEYEYETDSGCFSVKVLVKDEVTAGCQEHRKELSQEPPQEQEKPEDMLPYVGMKDLRDWKQLAK